MIELVAEALESWLCPSEVVFLKLVLLVRSVSVVKVVVPLCAVPRMSCLRLNHRQVGTLLFQRHLKE